MRAARAILVCVAGVMFALVVGGHVEASMLYKAVDLGNATATDINDLGQVVGWTGQQAFRTAPNQPLNGGTDLLGSITPGNSYAYGINNLGQVVGGATATGHTHAFCTGPNQPINAATDDLGTLGGYESYAYAINDRGEVVGDSMLPGDLFAHGFRSRPGVPLAPALDDLGSLGGPMSMAKAINSQGQVTGWSTRIAGTYGVFRTAPGSSINATTDDLGTLGGWTTVGGAINNLGQVAGYSTYSLASGLGHAFRTAPNQPIDPASDDLGAIDNGSPTIEDMNDRGDIVGSFLTQDDAMRAFVIIGSTMYDLNALVQGDLDLQVAHGINNSGQIVADSGNGHAYRLDPVPEPSTIALLSSAVLGGLALGLRRQGKRTVALWRPARGSRIVPERNGVIDEFSAPDLVAYRFKKHARTGFFVN